MSLIAFVHTEKTGGITLNGVLQKSFGWRHCDVRTIRTRQKAFQNEDFMLVKRVYPCLESIAGHKIRPYVDLNDSVRYFTFLREPVKRCISHYQFHVRANNEQRPFEEWIRQDYLRNHQTKKIAGTDDVEKAIALLEDRFFFVGLTERFDESLDLLNRLLGHRLDTSYTTQNVAPDNSIRDAIRSDPVRLRLAEEANELDRRLHAYVVERLYPRYKAEAEALPERSDDRGRRNKRTLNRVYRNAFYLPALKLARALGG
jgi:hypothetical protein